MNRPAANPHCLADSPSVSSANNTLHAKGVGGFVEIHRRTGARDPVFVMAVAILSFVFSQPESAHVDRELLRDSHYGLHVSPYKAAILATLGTVNSREGEADAEWQDFVLKLSVQLRRLRLEVGLSQEEVAHRAGLSRFIYRQYESGESRRGTAANPALRSILAIAQVLQVSVDDLLPKPIPDLRSR